MFVPNNYDDILQESKSGHHVVGSAWSFVSIVLAACWGVSLLVYLA
jgi:hypothetical protein